MSGHGRWEDVAQQGFQFSGTICAAVSHELKNRIAVVNEKAGLIEDLVQMMLSGRPVDPERLAAQAHSIKEQVRQANEILGNLNRFAHSADRPRHRCDVAELVALVVELCGRKASSAGVRLDLACPPAPVMLATSPFLLENVVFLCLELALSCAGAERVVDIAVEATAEGARVRFCSLDHVDNRIGDLGHTAETTALLAAVKVGVRTASEGSELILEADDFGATEVRS